MSNRSKRTGAATTPALVSNATPEGLVAEGGVMPAETPTTPAVPSTEPLPSDQATAPQRPAVAVGEDVLRPDLSDALVERPSIVPETPPVSDLAPPASDTPARPDVVMEHVPGTVPPPADQVTPVAPASRVDALASALADLTDEEVELFRRRLGISSPEAGADSWMLAAPGNDDPDGIRLFPVLYDVDLNGVSYQPGGEPIPLTFEEHRRLARATAVGMRWAEGKVLEDDDVL